jgi:hypothetical protein
VIAQKADNAHCGADVKGQFFDVDLTVSKRHNEEICYVKRKRKGREQTGCFYLRVLVFIS